MVRRTALRPSLVALAALLGATLAPAAELVSPSDPRLQYVGRWDFSDPERPWVGWQGASVKARFDGTGIQVLLGVAGSTDYFRVVIDGDAHGSRKFPVTADGPGRYRLAVDLPPGVHDVELVRETYSGGVATVYGFIVQGGDLVSPSPRPARRIEFYGDSNAAGTSLEHEEDQGATRYQGAYFTYPGIASRRLGAEHHNVSRGGETIPSIHHKLDRKIWWAEASQWDFDAFVPDVVVVNVGANDVGRSEQRIREDYHALLDELRALRPEAHIVLFNAFGWDYDEPADYTHQVVAERGDPNLSAAVFPWVFEQFHGCEYDHAGMADYLTRHLSEVMGWEVGPGDVMSGFGVDGDVANGSFEEIAPFGGYGWRYTSDPGAERVHDPAGAHHGEYYLRLSDGATTHQPNPASGGDRVSATVWMRGESEGARAAIKIDFRGQQIWTAALARSLETVTLTTDWQPYTISATAPILPDDPVFHSRLTLIARPGSTIAVDSISSTRESGPGAD